MLADSLKIVLLEDHQPDARLIQSMLSEAKQPSFEVIHVETLGEALDTLTRNTPDAALADLGLPDADGVETYSRLLSEFPNMPLVVLTGREDSAMGVKAVQMGVQDYLTKQEMNQDLLVRSIRYAIERHTLQEALAQARRVEQREEELKRADQYTNRTMSLTAQMFGSASLQETLPDTFAELLVRYGTLLDLAVEERTYKVRPRLAEEMRAFTEELEFLRAGPRDLMDLHVRALRHKLHSTAQARGHLEEGRFVLVELLGNLVSHYRSFALGLPAPPRSNPRS